MFIEHKGWCFVDQQLRVVLVEDEIQVRGYMQNLLECFDCTVNSLQSIDIAETCRAAAAADLLLIDTTLARRRPGIDVGEVASDSIPISAWSFSFQPATARDFLPLPEKVSTMYCPSRF